MKQPSVNIKNKRATFDYELMDTYTAGIVLTGTEIKSIRLGKACLLYTSPSPRDSTSSRMPSSA